MAEPVAFADLSTLLAAEAREAGAILILPIGAMEAHGPHLPLGTDDLLSTEMARRAVLRLRERGERAFVLPCISYSVAGFASAFAGTVSLSPGTATALVRDVCASLVRSGFRRLAIATAHLDPGHLAAVREALDGVEEETGARPAFADLTRRRIAERLGDEFASGACHAGRFESSLVLALAPALVDEARRAALPPLPVSLSEGIRAGKRTFEELGGRDAYFGDPAAATSQEGDATFDVLAAVLVEAILTSG